MNLTEPPAETATGAGGDDEWEICNDDGFIYKRKKRRRISSDPSSSAVAGDSSSVDPEAEERSRREWRRNVLTNLKRKYEVEIERWEILSNGLREMQEKAVRFQERRREQRREAEETASIRECDSGGAQRRPEDGAGMVLDELLMLTETQEGIIHGVSNFCDVAEAICNAREEQLKRSYFDLPIWGSPGELMAYLCCDD